MFINLSNHPSDRWSKEQLVAAQKYGEIIDIAFPKIDANCSEEDVDKIVEDYYKKVLEYDNPTVMVQGEFTFTYRLVSKLKEKGLNVLASCTQREVEIVDNPDGTVNKTSIFKFVRYREY
ncbi:MAG: hypothetical protein K5644_08820 [Lachnospiraceae bacterium]|nr:hypothetical protein [Lachnospiraceae bacterium]